MSVLPNRVFAAMTGERTVFKTATDEDLLIDGTLHGTVHIKDWEVEHEFCVRNVTSVMLGMDFLGPNEVIVCTGSRMVQLQSVHVPMEDEDKEYSVSVLASVGEKAEDWVEQEEEDCCRVEMLHAEDLMEEETWNVRGGEDNKQLEELPAVLEEFKEEFGTVFRGCNLLI